MPETIPAGTRFNRWVTTSEVYIYGAHPEGGGRAHVDAVCDCGTTRRVALKTLKEGRSKSCGCYKTDSLKGRRKKRDFTEHYSGGYTIYVWRNPAGRPVWMPVHRLVMERELGRELLPGENVHHINGVKDDNRPENLELWNTSQPSGQRIEEKLEWARELIAMYHPEWLTAVPGLQSPGSC